MKVHPSPFRNSMHRLFQRKTIRLSIAWLALVLLIALLAPILANDKPLYFSYNGHHYFPAFSGQESAEIHDEKEGERFRISFLQPDTSRKEKTTVVNAPVRFGPFKSDMLNTGYVGPFDEQFGTGNKTLAGSERHLLGTGRRGEDVLSGLIHGARISITVGIFSMVIAGIIGLWLGAVAGFFGDNALKLSRGQLLFTVIGIFPAWFYGFRIRDMVLLEALKEGPVSFVMQLVISMLIFFMIIFIVSRIGRLLHVIGWFRRKLNVPVDSIISRLIEILISLPRLILIIAIAAISKPSLVNLVLIIGLTSWTEIARFTRAELLRIKTLDYIHSARSLGLTEIRILLLHALPNAMAPALVAISFGVAGAILTESALSFLSIGVPPETVTWGSLLASGRENFSAWWLVVFPGFAIFLTVTAFNLLGEGIRDAFDPRMKI